ncbi:hypothetical protein FRB96_001949 [Tulasnella sp. 330]|nr:hypothetical protein FRB96_001949 [Tulasnella sp. 330]KAG8883129.1 hypothetical protein FRB98_003303 [Tulasnella sp. 332]
MAPFRITPQLWEKINHFAAFPQTGVSLQQMVLFGRDPSPAARLRGSQFLAAELPIRLAQRVKELDQLPPNPSLLPSINVIKNWYAQTFEELTSDPPPSLPAGFLVAASSASSQPPLPKATPNPINLKFSRLSTTYGTSTTGVGGPSTVASKGIRKSIPMEKRFYSSPDVPNSLPPELHAFNKKFTKILESIKHRHDPTLTTVAQGVLEWKHSKSKSANRATSKYTQDRLDRFYMSWIGIRFLIGQHVALNTLEPHPDWVGTICTKTNVHDISKQAIENAQFPFVSTIQILVMDQHGLIGASTRSHIVFELVKNSLRAVVERHGTNEASFPPIKVVIGKGKEDITIKISDEGGGIPRSASELIWSYMYTTMNLDAQQVEENLRHSDVKGPMAGFGYGLPLSRLYARYFGGDLHLISMEGYGTDVYIHLNRLSSTCEPLP